MQAGNYVRTEDGLLVSVLVIFERGSQEHKVSGDVRTTHGTQGIPLGMSQAAYVLEDCTISISVRKTQMQREKGVCLSSPSNLKLQCVSGSIEIEVY